jgi:hypothetical protein
MSTFKFADYRVDAGADQAGRVFVYLVCPHCSGTRSYFADYEEPVTLGDMITLAWDHHTQYHREPHLEGNGQ